MIELDHLVVAAASLDEGVHWCESTLGVTPAPGGKHASMGTHNRLVRIGARAYLEIIAVDPQAPVPARPRWFGLDHAVVGPPRLIHWVVRSRMWDMHRWGLIQKGLDPGVPLAASRGELSWNLLVRSDGALLAAGAVPSIIDWRSQGHPCDALPDQGVELLALRVAMPDAARAVLSWRGPRLDVPGLQAVLATPLGTVTLSGQAP